MCGSKMVDIQSATAEIRRGKKKERKKERKKKHDKNIMSASATQFDHKKPQRRNIMADDSNTCDSIATVAQIALFTP